ncbi:MAG: hypothetical protein K0S41_1242 [Anaerocolumna sp.]|jgi:hypothetical protein|nr:hypothetical protein [Anaerocolumna sp.]
MEEKNFMLKYHNAAVTTSKDKRVQKYYYFVVKYKTSEGDDKYLAFWSTIMEYSKLNKMKNLKLNDNPTSYQL